MGTVGKTTIGVGGYTNFDANYCEGNMFAMPQAGSLQTFNFYGGGLGPGTGNQVWKAAVYADNAGNLGALLCQTAEQTMVDGTATGWVLGVPFITHPDVANGVNVWLVILSGANANTLQVLYDGGGIYAGYAVPSYASGFQNPGGNWLGTEQRAHSIYATLGPVTPTITAVQVGSDIQIGYS